MADGEIMMPVTTEEALRKAEMMAFRQMTDTLRAVQEELASHRAQMGTIGQDIAVIKERQTTMSEIKDDMESVKERLLVLEMRNARQDGAVTFVTFLKDFGPWLFGLLVLAWGLFSRKPG